MSTDPPLETLKSSKYDVERVLGRGGMGTVFQARHTRLGHRVAIKILADDLRKHPDLVTRFEREARAASALSSPHAVRVFDIDATDDGIPFMVMELLSGRDLQQLLGSGGPQPVGTAVRWIIEACDAIAEAHRLGIVHRDIKPANLLLCDGSGSIKVLDFGIAKRVATNARDREAAITANVAPLGTPQYMSPEQVRCSREVDTRTDIWSLGVTLYELLTGRPPYNNDIPQACIAAVVIDPIPDPRDFQLSLPEELVVVLLRALEKDADDRYQTVEELVQALLPFADRTSGHDLGSFSLATTVRPRTTADDAVIQAHKFLKPRRLALGWLGGAVLGLAALTSTTRFVDSDARDAPIAAAAPSPRRSSEPLPRPAEVPDVADAESNSSSPDTVAQAPSKVDGRPPTRKSVMSIPRPLPKLRALPMGRSVGRQGSRIVTSDRPVHGGMSNPGF